MPDGARPGDVVARLLPHQARARATETRFDVRVWARRSGKTWYTVLRMLERALMAGDPSRQAFYLAPTRVQAKAIAWPYLTAWARPVGADLMVSELKVMLPGAGFIQLGGAEQYDRLRGLYMDDVTLDECAHIPSDAWTKVISPAIADRRGRVTFMGTPQGRMNLLHDVWTEAGGDDAEWSRSLLNWEQAGVLDPAEVKRAQARMSEEEFAQEFLCSWDGALRGSYYAKQMAQVEAGGRVTDVLRDAALPVHVALDLGWSDSMVAVFFQLAGTEVRILAAEAYERTSIPEMVEQWRGIVPRIDTVVLPHDARVSELGTGRTRQEVFHSLGYATSIAPNQKVHEGVAQVRDMLEHCWFDRTATRTLREALGAYRSEYDEVRQVYSTRPVHDWSSHWADAMRYLALGRPAASSMEAWGERDLSGLGVI